MILRPTLIAASAAIAMGSAAGAEIAASSAASSASESVSASVGSVSNSITGSSRSSSPATTAQGDYRVIEVAELPERPGELRLRLQPLQPDAGGEGFFLHLPRAVFERTGVATGQVVTARQRPYGIEFARGTPREAFFLVLADEWHRELQAHPVSL